MSSLGVSILNVVIHECRYKVLAIFIDANMRIKGVQIGGHEMKIINFPDDTTIFLLTDINWNTRIQSILKPKASSSKTNFSKFQALSADI